MLVMAQKDIQKTKEFIDRVKLSDKIREDGEAVREEVLQEVNRRIDISLKRVWWIHRLSIAASLAAMICVISYFSYKKGCRQNSAQLVYLNNPMGAKSYVELPDGTNVSLNGGTTLVYPEAFVSGIREVSVVGEAFFDVVADKKHPFIVKSEGLRVQVTGTKFNVKSYQEDAVIEVSLKEGRVNVSGSSGSEIVMESGEKLSYNKSDGKFVRKKIDPDMSGAWRDGKFYFKGCTLEDIARQLERSFNVHIAIEENLRQVVYSGNFVHSESLEQILKVMSADGRIRYRMEGEQIYLSDKWYNVENQ